jgi:hypothetical protein
VVDEAVQELYHHVPALVMLSFPLTRFLLLASALSCFGGSFVKLDTERTGIDFEHTWNPPAGLEDMISGSFTGGGVAIGDYDGDGKPDLFFTDPADGGQLYRNLGDFHFENATRKAGLTVASGWSAGTTWADVNGDGRLDLFVCMFGTANRLYLNLGDGTFIEVAQASGLTFRGASLMAAFADYDRDGDLDLYLVTNRIKPPPGLLQERFNVATGPDGEPSLPDRYAQYAGLVKMPDGKYKQVASAQFDYLFRNDGNDGAGRPQFTDVSKAAGIWTTGYGLSATWWDYDSDGWLDLYVANDFYGADRLYRNNKDGTFSDVAPNVLPHTPWFSMGSDVADINNDGRLDYMASDMAGSTHYKEKMSMGNMTGRESDSWFLNFPSPRQYMRNAVYLNTGTGRFMEVAHLCGMAATDWTWAVKFADFDCDGRDDVFISTGMSRDWFNSDLRKQEEDLIANGGRAAANAFWEKQKPLASANWAFRNAGDLRFENVGKAWGLAGDSVSYGAALGDLDGDLDLDLVVNNFDGKPSIYRNDLAGGNRLALRLKGQGGNSWGVGATVVAHLETEPALQTKTLALSRGFMSSNEPLLHFGLGEATALESLVITWPSGTRQEVGKLAAGNLHIITEPKTGIAPPTSPRPMFASSSMFRGIAHGERPYDDFRRQPLLPSKLSQLGPGIAWGDVNRDGRQDFYLGRAAGAYGGIYLRLETPTSQGAHFVVDTFDPFEADAACEDIAPLFFDADRDGDLDLYVVSGGVECEPGAAVLRDRLYLNGGKGSFTKAPAGTLPEANISGGAACAADFDRDGDLDLFVGGRSIPGRYPETPRSQLLRNDSRQGAPKFVEVTPKGLATTGLVTAARWADFNGDHWPDLLVAHEWGPVKLYLNKEGSLAEASTMSGLQPFTGWWNSLAVADVDGDGDLDFAAGNVGLNSKYHASPEHPAVLYYGDVDGSGRKRIVEAKFEGATMVPVRGFSCSRNAMPSLGKQHSNFHSFATKTLAELYPEQRLGAATRHEANTLQSGIFVNGGTGNFTFRPLPRLAQAAPIFAMVFSDLERDGDLDLCAVGNSFSSQPETGHMDGGVGLILRNNGAGFFEAISPAESGLVIPGDAKSLNLIDLNRDGRPDLVAGINNGDVMAFLRSGRSQ